KPAATRIIFSQSLDGFLFMMLDEPIQWDDTVDKEKVLDGVFASEKVTKAMMLWWLYMEPLKKNLSVKH
ncbi:MAG: hypothetical protein HC786_32210, partial [Richelia sp. CSU_2_1]|nr:hypothetical protein [Richelia sp. CSU_2_1]